MRPKVILHSAVSVDGRMDGIAPDLGVYYGLAQRFGEDGTLCGSTTLLAALPPDKDDAKVAPIDKRDSKPLAVVVDGRGRVRSWGALRESGYWRGVVALCCRKTPKRHLAYLTKRGVEHLIVGEDKVDLAAALEQLAKKYRLRTVRVDGGGSLNGALARAGLVDEVSVLVCPTLVGGLTPRSLLVAPDLASGQPSIPLALRSVEALEGGYVWMRWDVARRRAKDGAGRRPSPARAKRGKAA